MKMSLKTYRRHYVVVERLIPRSDSPVDTSQAVRMVRHGKGVMG